MICDQFQVPESSSIKSVEELAGKRVVTSFEVLAGKYFDELDAKLGLVSEQRTKIEYVGGSVEAACSLGLADGIGRQREFITIPITSPCLKSFIF